MEIEIIMIHFSSVEIDINFLLVFSLLGSWLFITWGKGAFCWEIIKVIIGVRGSFSEKGSLPVGGGGGGQFNKSYESSTE